MLKKWIEISREVVFKAIVFEYMKVRRKSPNSEVEATFDVIKCHDWVNVVAFTDSGECILVNQYRHGTDDFSLEVPGGVVDRGEDFLEACKRELKEETGYTSEDWIYLGEYHPNPAFITNNCRTYLANNCVKTHEQNLDELEEIEVQLIQREDLAKMCLSGEINHSITLSALHLKNCYDLDLR